MRTNAEQSPKDCSAYFFIQNGRIGSSTMGEVVPSVLFSVGVGGSDVSPLSLGAAVEPFPIVAPVVVSGASVVIAAVVT